MSETPDQKTDFKDAAGSDGIDPVADQFTAIVLSQTKLIVGISVLIAAGVTQYFVTPILVRSVERIAKVGKADGNQKTAFAESKSNSESPKTTDKKDNKNQTKSGINPRPNSFPTSKGSRNQPKPPEKKSSSSKPRTSTNSNSKDTTSSSRQKTNSSSSKSQSSKSSSSKGTTKSSSSNSSSTKSTTTTIELSPTSYLGQIYSKRCGKTGMYALDGKYMNDYSSFPFTSSKYKLQQGYTPVITFQQLDLDLADRIVVYKGAKDWQLLHGKTRLGKITFENNQLRFSWNSTSTDARLKKLLYTMIWHLKFEDTKGKTVASRSYQLFLPTSRSGQSWNVGVNFSKKSSKLLAAEVTDRNKDAFQLIFSLSKQGKGKFYAPLRYYPTTSGQTTSIYANNFPYLRVDEFRMSDKGNYVYVDYAQIIPDRIKYLPTNLSYTDLKNRVAKLNTKWEERSAEELLGRLNSKDKTGLEKSSYVFEPIMQFKSTDVSSKAPLYVSLISE